MPTPLDKIVGPVVLISMHSLIILSAGYDFGYEWQWTHGHLIPASACAALALLAWSRHWRWVGFVTAAIAAWALLGFAIVSFGLMPNSPLALPTAEFLKSGAGQVLDIGAGSGRATLMVLLARPQSQVTVLDRFAAGYGIEANSPERLLANARVAGVESRIKVQTGDARQMPFAANSFEAAVSTYVIDHLGRTGAAQALTEINRVLRPDGQFLLMVINRDIWVKLAYPFLHGHGYFGQMPARRYWLTSLETAGLEPLLDGTTPGTLYILARKKRE